MYNFNSHTDKSRAEMLEKIGVKSVEDLFKQIPKEARMSEKDAADFGTPKNEIDTVKIVKKLASKNKTDYISFLGGGAYNRFIPACVGE